MNLILLSGNLAKDVDFRITQSGKSVANFQIAVTRRNDSIRGADFFSCVAWGMVAELLQKYTRKGSRIAIKGYVEVVNYTAKDGTNRKNVQVVTEEIEIIGAAAKTKEKGEQVEGKLPPKAAHKIVRQADKKPYTPPNMENYDLEAEYEGKPYDAPPYADLEEVDDVDDEELPF